MSGSQLRDEEMGLEGEKEPLLPKQAIAAVEEKIADLGGKDIIQFSSPMYFVDESEGAVQVEGREQCQVTVEVIRVGNMKGKLAVHYFTEDGSAKELEQYESASGQLVFEEGEYTKSIQVTVLDDGLWSPTAEFKLRLARPQNCMLGLYLHTSRVKIMNSEPFPSTAYEEEIEKGADAIKTIPEWGLFWEYCCLNFDIAGVKWQTLLVLVLDQMSNIFLFVSLWAGVYIVDTVFAQGVGSHGRLLVPNRYHTAVIVACWFVAPVFVLYVWDTCKARMDIKGISRSFLQMALMNTYLNYSKESRDQVPPAELVTAIESGAGQLGDGYVATLNLVAIIGKLITIEIFIILFQPEALAIFTVLGMVLALVGFAIMRTEVAKEQAEVVNEKDEAVSMLAEETCRKFQLIADYSKRPLVNEMFVIATNAVSEAKIPEAIAKLNTQYTAKFLSGIIIAAYIIVKAPAVFNNTLSLGVFLATISIFSTYLSDALNDLNTQLMVILDAFVPLKDLTRQLNMPLELEALKKINEQRRRQSEQKRQSISGEEFQDGKFKCDLIDIAASNLSFEYKPGVPVLKNVNLSIPQGSLIAVTGQHKSGKKTFIDLISNISTPTAGVWFVPPHLRVVHVSNDPVLLQTSMLGNLSLGLPQDAPIDLDRIYSILKVCGLKDVVTILESEEAERGKKSGSVNSTVQREHIQFMPSCGWVKQMTLSQMVRLHVARALIANAEVLIIQRTLGGLNEDGAKSMLDAIRQHVNEKGLFLPAETKWARRPRTVFFSTESAEQAAKADTILQLDPQNKIVLGPGAVPAAGTRRMLTPSSGCFPTRT